jgi:hypothetical protein
MRGPHQRRPPPPRLAKPLSKDKFAWLPGEQVEGPPRRKAIEAVHSLPLARSATAARASEASP